MASTKPAPAPHCNAAGSSWAVDAFMATLDPPCKAGIEALRRTILGADPFIAGNIKWKASSLRTTEYFATTNLRTKGGVGLILHLGTMVRDR